MIYKFNVDIYILQWYNITYGKQYSGGESVPFEPQPYAITDRSRVLRKPSYDRVACAIVVFSLLIRIQVLIYRACYNESKLILIFFIIQKNGFIII